MAGMARKLRDRGYNTVVFNLRGVGASTGSPTICGCTEPEDVEAVVRYIVEKIPCQKVFLVGSSAGAPIAGSVVNNVDEIQGYVGIGYVFGCATAIFFGFHYPRVMCSKKRRLFINGSCDMFTSMCEFLCCKLLMSGPREDHTIPGVGHFEMEGPSYDNYMVNLIEQFIRGGEIENGSYGLCYWCLPTSCCSTCVFGTFAAVALVVLAATTGL
eukprot:CAMPEP_0114499724 /NCGR_PEP_ID=MMETSP0109-20121206/7575_1 /TAXON_ID=29199 /ORGANISM="Chlorarachnion reptans, Strain CCCM449" /LENGTH=212 /DNA_ID=CAMNT_0001677321 /DNA_START=367 /DNA_END=1005 /DNA_ORIENTATION=+